MRYFALILAAIIAVGLFFLYQPPQVPTNGGLSDEQLLDYAKSSAPTNGSLSDEQLLNYAKSSFNKEEMMFKDFILGSNNGVPVRVFFPCSDVCPDYTIRIISYNVSLSDCTSAGGELKSIYVPLGIAVMPKEFCFPKVIVANGVYDFVAK